MHVYPTIEEHVPNGAGEVEHDKQEHDEIVKVTKRMEDVDASDPIFMEKVRELEAMLRHHVSDEESEQFPQLRAHIPADKLVDLGQKVEMGWLAACPLSGDLRGKRTLLVWQSWGRKQSVRF